MGTTFERKDRMQLNPRKSNPMSWTLSKFLFLRPILRRRDFQIGVPTALEHLKQKRRADISQRPQACVISQGYPIASMDLSLLRKEIYENPQFDPVVHGRFLTCSSALNARQGRAEYERGPGQRTRSRSAKRESRVKQVPQ